MITTLPESEARRPANNVATKYNRKVGRPKGASDYPMEFRALVGVLGKVSGVRSTSRAFEMSPGTPSAYKDGKVSRTDESLNSELTERINQILEPVHTLAVQKTMAALEAITPEKLAASKALDASRIAANLAVVVDKVSPIVPKTEETLPQMQQQVIQVYKPETKALADFNVVAVRGDG